MDTSDINEADSDSDNSNTSLINENDIKGYMSNDLATALSSHGKQTRVLLYIVLALLPCLFLVPFFMSRDFIPPIE
jgi:hypothetical protein